MTTKKHMTTRMMAQIGMLAAIATVLTLIKIPVPFAPTFYKLDFSEIPVLIGCFSMGPLAGAILELLKTLLNLAIDGTVTAGVGEAANFVMGCALCVPAGVIYKRKRTRQGALIGLAVGVLLMTVAGCLLNAYVLLPAYSAASHMPIGDLVKMGTKINGGIRNLPTFVAFAVAPFNLLKGVVSALIVFFIYKKISPILKLHD